MTTKRQLTASIVDKLAGSIKLPRRFKGMDIETIIELARKEYLRNKYRKLEKE